MQSVQKAETAQPQYPEATGFLSSADGTIWLCSVPVAQLQEQWVGQLGACLG